MPAEAVSLMRAMRADTHHDSERKKLQSEAEYIDAGPFAHLNFPLAKHGRSIHWVQIGGLQNVVRTTALGSASGHWERLHRTAVSGRLRPLS